MPIVGDQQVMGVRGVFEHIVVAVGVAVLDRRDFGPDRDHRLAETVELALGLAFRRFDHQRIGDRERHGRRVETVIDQPLGHVVDGYAG